MEHAITTSPTPSRADVVAREDVVLFVNACFACTNQNEFYGDSRGQAVAISFLHDYVLGNYRRLYARTLAIGINHMNQAEILFRLLASGRETQPEDRREEGDLIRSALAGLPPPRALRLFKRLRDERVNNRRTRAVIRDYLSGRRDPIYDAVKYRSKVACAVRHAHLKRDGEFGRFLFTKSGDAYGTPLFESYRQAHYSRAAIFELPYTVAEGFAAKHGVPRKVFLEKIEPRLTTGERLRLQRASEAATGEAYELDPETVGVTRLALYLLSLSVYERRGRAEEFERFMEAAAERAVRAKSLGLGRVACVLDRSYSASGSRTKRRRPLAVALGASWIVRTMARESKDFWTQALPEEASSRVEVTAAGQTNLVDPLIDALEWSPDLVVIVSDGHENDPPGGVQAVVSAYRRDMDPEHRVSFVHINPVFDAEWFEPRTLGAALPTVGVRDAEDLATMLAFARFVDGGSDLKTLENYLEVEVAALFRRTGSKTTGGEA